VLPRACSVRLGLFNNGRPCVFSNCGSRVCRKAKREPSRLARPDQIAVLTPRLLKAPLLATLVACRGGRTCEATSDEVFDG
jgi:hypothetical protein